MVVYFLKEASMVKDYIIQLCERSEQAVVVT